MQSVILKGDSRVEIKPIENSVQDLSYNGSLVHEISILGLNFIRFKIEYVSRCRNTKADTLVHLAKLVGTRLWIGEVSRCIRDLVTLDL